jgi:Na+/H+ antiporter NhaC
MMLMIAVMNIDFGPMKKHEINALNGDLFTSGKVAESTEKLPKNEKGKVIDLVFPVVILIFCCVIGMIYSGGFFGPDGVGFIEAFSNSDASIGLAMGSIAALIISVIFYLIRKVLKFKECMECIPDGFKQMVPAILILTFAWTLKAMTDSLGAKEYVASIIAGSAEGFVNFLPAIVFLVGCFLAFATGTSWGTFGILIPIVVAVFSGTNPQLMIISISACMAGAVCGDHCSPISDTTIMASAGAQSDHINHVNTQLPYAMVCAAVSFVTYIVAGFTQKAWIALPVGIIIMVGVMYVIRYSTRDTAEKAAD